MKKWISILGALLALQIALAAGLFLSRDRYGAFVSEEKMLAFDVKEVDALEIEGGEKKRLVLKKEGDVWTIPAMDGFPADGGAVERLLEKLDDLERGWPVATTSGAAKRFKVADEEFERKLTLSKDDEIIASLFVGSSPGLRKVHVRHPGEDEVYSVELNTYEMEIDGEDWIDKSVLSLKADDVAGLELPDLTLVRRENGMAPDDLAEDEEMVAEEIDRAIDRIADLKIRAVLGKEEKPEYLQGEPELKCIVKLTSGESREYVFSKPKDESYYVLKSSAREEYFSVDTWIVDRIKELEREKLVRKKEVEKDGEGEEEPGSSVDAGTTTKDGGGS